MKTRDEKAKNLLALANHIRQQAEIAAQVCTEAHAEYMRVVKIAGGRDDYAEPFLTRTSAAVDKLVLGLNRVQEQVKEGGQV